MVDKIDISRKDFFNSLDLPYDEGDFIDTEECEILYMYFLDINPNPLITIFKNFRMEYSDLHKSFLIEKVGGLIPNSCLFNFIIRDSSFSTLDFLSLLPVSFYRTFCRYLSKTNLFFLDTLLEYEQTIKVFEDSLFWSPPWYSLNEDMDLLYNIIKKMICQNNKIKENFILSINLLIKNNQERNKMVHKKEEVISDKEAYNLNILINRFVSYIIKRKLSLEGKFNRFVFVSKVEIFKLSFIKMIEERKFLKMEEEETGEIDELLRNIINEKEFGEYLGELLLNRDLLFDTEDDNLYTSLGTIYLYIYEFLSPCYPVLFFLFQFDIHKQHILRVLVSNPNMLKFSFLNKIIEYYNAIQKEGYKIEVRYLINLILVDNNVLILKTCIRNVKFINYLMSDFEYCLSRGLSGIGEMNIVLKKLHDNINITHDDIKNLIMEIRILKKRISSSFIFIDTCFKLLNKIIDKNVDILLVEELISVFVKILNCNMRTIVGPKCSELIIRNPFISKNHILSKINKDSLKFRPKELLRNILLIYIGIKENKFIKAVCQEEMYFDLELFKIGKEICENKYLINNCQINELNNLIRKFEKYKKEEEEEEIDMEFIDPLTYDIIKEPVILLTSNVTIDKSTYNMIMLNDGIDPFNREPLDESKIVEDIKMKEEINKRKNN